MDRGMILICFYSGVLIAGNELILVLVLLPTHNRASESSRPQQLPNRHGAPLRGVPPEEIASRWARHYLKSRL